MENTEVITPNGEAVSEAEVKEPQVAVVPPKKEKPQRTGNIKRTENILGWVYISPMVIGLLLFTLVPLVMSIIGMFYEWDPKYPLFESTAVGFANFKSIFGGLNSKMFWSSFGNTLVFAVQLPVGMIVALFLALAMNRDMKGVQTFRVLYYIPCIMSVVAVSIVWQKIFDANGLIDSMFGTRLLNSRSGIYFVINLFLIWKGVGYTTLMFVAGLQSVSTDQLEAARIDGANSWIILIKITLPALYDTIFYLFVTGLMGALQMFNEPFLILGETGGFQQSGLTVVGFVYYFKGQENIGISSVAAWVLAFFIFIITAIQLYVDKKKQEAS